MIACIVILVLLAGLWIKFRNYKKEVFEKLPKKGNELKSLYPMACGILMLFKKYKLEFSNQRRRKKIESLNVVKDEKETELIYNIRRLSYSIAIVGVTAILAFLYCISRGDTAQIRNYQVKRQGYAGEKTQVAFLANNEEVLVEINPREFSMEETQENFQKAYGMILQEMTGENISLQQVSQNLNLMTYLEDYAVKITWMSSNPQLIDTFGNVYNDNFLDDESENVTLTAVLSYLDMECQYEITVEVTAPVLTEQELFIRNLIRIINENDEQSRTDETVLFPNEIDGRKIRYEEKREDYTFLLILLGVVTAIIIFPGMDKELDSKMDERKKEMLLDYSEIVSKLNILSGAGMSILKAWERIVKDYEKKVKKNPEICRYAYEEMKITYYEIQSGISEASAYMAFGRRCNIHEYLKLGALLEQNVKKGAKGLAKMLESESIGAFEQRKNLAKKLGEEAGTKLLIPMIIMLAIVMVIVLIPAFTSFGI